MLYCGPCVYRSVQYQQNKVFFPLIFMHRWLTFLIKLYVVTNNPYCAIKPLLIVLFWFKGSFLTKLDDVQMCNIWIHCMLSAVCILSLSLKHLNSPQKMHFWCLQVTLLLHSIPLLKIDAVETIFQGPTFLDKHSFGRKFFLRKRQRN